MNKAPCQRSHGLRFEPGTAANRTVFKAQGHVDWTTGARTKAGVLPKLYLILRRPHTLMIAAYLATRAPKVYAERRHDTLHVVTL